MLRFLGSLPFAIGLICTTVVFVVAGTVLESWAESHLFAAGLTYHNPVFRVLLGLYFVNILLSALSRFPFEKKHVPFLMTHLGLLLLLAGVFVKNHYGVQGACALVEGAGSSHIYIADSYALLVEGKEDRKLIPLKKGKLGKVGDVEIVEWLPHAEEKLEGFMKGGWGHIVGLPPFKEIETPEYQIAARKSAEVHFPGKAALFFIQDEHGAEKLVAFNGDGEKYEQTLDATSFYVYNKGYGGYGLFAELPSHFPHIDLIAPLTRCWKVTPLPRKREEATPRIRLLVQNEVVALGYDKYGQGFKWPTAQGSCLLRFQSYQQEIPFHMRLQSATQVNYPGTAQPYSYEAKLLIDGDEVLLSMNHVYEKRGYRFYLANLIEKLGSARQVQIVVNYDPAKYWLTYPGAIILALGIVLLYLRKRYV